MSMDVERVQEVLGTGERQSMVEEKIPVLPISATMAASAADEADDVLDALGLTGEEAVRNALVWSLQARDALRIATVNVIATAHRERMAIEELEGAEAPSEDPRGRSDTRGPGMGLGTYRDRSRSREKKDVQSRDFPSAPRERSTRIANAQHERDQAARAAMIARQQKEAAQLAAKRAAEQATALLRGSRPKRTPIKGVIGKLVNRETVYLSASRVLGPVMLGGIGGDSLVDPGTARITFPQLFTMGLKDVCRTIYGVKLTDDLQSQFDSVRNFFEVTDPQDQCEAILAPFSDNHPIKTHCWICGTKLQLPPCDPKCQQDCEHKADLLLAMMTTGIYDRYLHMILVRTGRSEEYKDLLKFEYAYAHPVCNQLKKDIHFITGSVGGDGTVGFQSNTKNIADTLKTVFGRDTTKIPGPQPNIIRGQFHKQTWDGNLRTDRLTPAADISEDAYLANRVAVIQASLQELVLKLNNQKLTAKALCLRITRGFLYRAIELAPELTRDALWDSLEEEYKKALDRRINGKGRRRTPRRNRTRKQLRGGGPQEDFDDAVDVVVEYIVYCQSLRQLDADLKARNGTFTNEFEAMNFLDSAMDAHSERAYTTLRAIDWDALHAKVDPLQGADVVQVILDALGIPNRAAPAAMEDEGAPAPAAMAEEVAPVTATPERVNTRPPPGSLATVEGSFGSPTGSLSSSFSPANGSLQPFTLPPDDTAPVAPVVPVVPVAPVVQQRLAPPRSTSGSESEGPKGGFKFTMGKRPNWL